MLTHSRFDLARHSNVEHVRAAGHDVRIVAMLASHAVALYGKPFGSWQRRGHQHLRPKHHARSFAAKSAAQDDKAWGAAILTGPK